MNKTQTFSLRFLAVLLASLGLCHCGPDGDALCESSQACIGGNDKDLEACGLGFDALADLADSLGCSDEFDAYFICYEENADCRTEASGGQCMTVDDCPNGGSDDSYTCSGGQCQRRSFGLPSSTNGSDGPCEVEQNAFNRCM